MTYGTGGKAFKLSGVPELKKTLREIVKGLNYEGQQKYTEMIKDALMKPAKTIRDEAQDMVPVVTGKLKAAIFAAPMLKRPGALAGVHVQDAHYAPFVEYGTSKAPAHPYFRPAILATRPIAAVMIAEDIARIIDVMARDNAWHASEGTP
jgi:HK97 gp10 family phage protein